MIAKGSESKEAQEFKRYIGVCPVFIKAINPDKKEHETLFNTTLESAPNYLGTITDSEGNEYANARTQVVLQPDTEKLGFEMPLITMGLFIQNRPKVSTKLGKVQVIDRYGRTAWVTNEQLETHEIPMWSTGPANIDKDYRPAYVGEEELMEFVKAYLCIPNINVWDASSRTFVLNTQIKPEECECRFDNLGNIFKGDFSEIKDALGFQPYNKVKVMLGVRTDPESGRLYQTVYTRKFLRNSATNYNLFDKEIQSMVGNAMAGGRVLNTEYEANPVHEYSVKATTFTPSAETMPSNDLPFETKDDENDLPW